MRTRSLHWLVALALGGCAAIDSFHESSRQADFAREFAGGVLCNSQDCRVDITVGPNCAITPSSPTLGVDARISDATIHWRIVSAGASFTRDGINAEPPKDRGAWMREFKNPRLVSDTEFTWLDKNKLPGSPRKRSYGYNIFVNQGATTCRFDPTIINDY